jgi:hypothetical protein
MMDVGVDGTGAWQRASQYTDEHETPNRCAETPGQARGGGRDASMNVEVEGDGARERGS